MDDDELKRYIEDVRTIRRTLDEAEGSFRIFAWFYHAMAALILAGTGINFLLSRTIQMTIHESFVFIWIPVFFVAGAGEMVAWVIKSTREKVPLVTPLFLKYIVAFSGITIGLFMFGFLLIVPGMPAPGVVLLIVGMMFCVPVQYTHIWFTVEAFGLILVGFCFILLHVQGPAYFVADGIIVSMMLAVGGIIERILSGHDHHG
ncbi:MAG TPA: hypothetical protein VMW73_06765 [Spirochaetia bacterium]|nr:hypothetical protein [Spirochaetia bacterium]